MTMHLEILAPDRVVLALPVRAVQAGDASGRFGLWPGHEAICTVLVPGILHFRDAEGRERYAAVDGGVLFSEGGTVSVATRDAVVADRLEDLANAAATMLRARREHEQTAQTDFQDLEMSLLRELTKAVRSHA
jgi:F-type H+-transporting ATPase subunit epsilon